MEVKEYEELKGHYGDTLVTIVTKLLRCKEGVLCYVNFNGTKLYSDTIDMDKAYLEIHGKTKAEFDQSMEDFQARLKQSHNEYVASLPELESHWSKRGREILPEDKWSAWDSKVKTQVRDIHKGSDLGYGLAIIQLLNKDVSFNDAETELNNQNHSGYSRSLVLGIISEFHPKGLDFMKHVMY